MCYAIFLLHKLLSKFPTYKSTQIHSTNIKVATWTYNRKPLYLLLSCRHAKILQFHALLTPRCDTRTCKSIIVVVGSPHMQLFDSAFIETAPSLETIRVWGYPLTDTLAQKTTYVRPSHADFSSTMPRNSIESQRSAAKSIKSDGDGNFYELELGGGVENAPTTLSPIGDPSLPTPEGPCDGGTQAFLFFGSAFMIEALLWGMFASFFQFTFQSQVSMPNSSYLSSKI